MVVTQKARVSGTDLIVELWQGGKPMEGGRRVYPDFACYYQGLDPETGRLLFSIPKEASLKTGS